MEGGVDVWVGEAVVCTVRGGKRGKGRGTNPSTEAMRSRFERDILRGGGWEVEGVSVWDIRSYVMLVDIHTFAAVRARWGRWGSAAG